jgi:hypothetical protein
MPFGYPMLIGDRRHTDEAMTSVWVVLARLGEPLVIRGSASGPCVVVGSWASGWVSAISNPSSPQQEVIMRKVWSVAAVAVVAALTFGGATLAELESRAASGCAAGCGGGMA